MESAAFLELESIKKGLHVLGSGVAKVGEHICPPSVAIASGQVTAGNLFQNVGYMNGFNCGDVRHVLEIVGSHVLQEGWKRKCPLIWTYGNKKGRVTILADCVNEVKVLVLPEGLAK